MKKKVTQRDRVIQYINDFGSISSWEAYRDLGITQLATRRFELKKMGYKFDTERISTKNRYGDASHYFKYTLVEEKI